MTDEHSVGEPVAADRSGVGFLLGYTARLLWRQLRESLEGFGLDDSSYIVFVNVAIAEEQSGEGLLASELVERYALRPEDVDAAAARLTRLGLLKVKHEDVSARLALTHKGRSVMPVIQDEVRWMLENALSGLTYEEIDGLSERLRHVIANLGGHLQ